VDLAGELRMTTPGRIRIYAGQLAGWWPYRLCRGLQSGRR